MATFAVFWIVFSILAGVFAGRRGRSGVGFFLVALVLSPLVSFVWAAVFPRGKKCPYCSETIKSGARVCRFCGREFPAAETLPRQLGSVSLPTATEIRPPSAPDRTGELAPSSKWKNQRTRRWPVAIAIASSILILLIVGVYHARKAVPAAGTPAPRPASPVDLFPGHRTERGPRGEVLCGRVDKLVNTLVDYTQTYCFYGRGRRAGTYSLLLLSSRPVFSVDSSKKAWLLVAVAAVGDTLNRSPSVRPDQLWLSDENLMGKRVVYVLPAAAAKSLQHRVKSNQITLQAMYAAISADLRRETIAKK